jgi:hypothetical protein
MSRVDDDREAARATERLMEARRNEERMKGKKAAESISFKKLVGQQQEQGRHARERQVVENQHELGKNAIAALREGSEAHANEQSQVSRKGQQTFTSLLKGSNASETLNRAIRDDGVHQQTVADGGYQVDHQSAQTAQGDKGTTARALEGRKSDAKQGRAALEEAHESSDLSSIAAAGTGGARGEKGELKGDADKGAGGQGGGGQKDQKDSPAMPTAFRLNPALMPPVPVAKQKEVSGSERLRQVANELAQKIVEKVRIGTNAAGKVEFQIDLRSDVLKGLSVKVSGTHGRISAVFQGSDRDVMKLLEEQKEALTKALAARGLTLQDFKIEGRP